LIPLKFQALPEVLVGKVSLQHLLLIKADNGCLGSCCRRRTY